MKTDWNKIQNESEVSCVQNFLLHYNVFHKSNFVDPLNNIVQDEVDVICRDFSSGENLFIQVKKAHPKQIKNIAISKKAQIETRSFVARNINIVNEICDWIIEVEIKYRSQQKDMSNIVLLLDEIADLPKFIFESISNRIKSSIFKEIWLVTRYGDTYKLF